MVQRREKGSGSIYDIVRTAKERGQSRLPTSEADRHKSVLASIASTTARRVGAPRSLRPDLGLRIPLLYDIPPRV